MADHPLFPAWRALGWAGVAAVATLSLVPVPPEAVAAAGGDKLVHFAGYTLLGAWFGQLHHESAARWRVLAGLVLLGVALEGLQGLVPWRSMNGWDALANAAGAAAGLLATRGRGGRVLERLAGEPRTRSGKGT